MKRQGDKQEEREGQVNEIDVGAPNNCCYITKEKRKRQGDKQEEREIQVNEIDIDK